MPADPIADFLISRGIDPEALVLAVVGTFAVGAFAFLIRIATSGVEF